MHIETKYHGTITVPEPDHLHFSGGLPGFTDERAFVLLPFGEETPYYVLQSVKTKEVAFVVTNPFLFYNDYQFKLEDHTKQALDIQSREEVAVYVVVTLRDPFNTSTVNLKAPIVINQRTRQARQTVLEYEAYQTRHPLFPKEKEAAECSY
ncbi:flagellar assembly protein FliW [Bacillaceae bacterium SIJ1]|uniref:flagellar assembly protein FliW n=1 Tax=Litoribacterium kuwaitense TaxID=1398745 RepID=UPI0013EC3398|nr:flagellar assembly protein FliW [Litoribacterium kuwaitense]NGP44937.1 flagellar assembly protein FliW [Litoribacterium kuwaitense]